MSRQTNMQQYKNHYSQHADLKPKLQAQSSVYQITDYLSDEPIASDEPLVGEYAQLQDSDQRLKQRIRILKFISRVIAFGLSLVTLVPLAMTVAKYLLTKNDYFNVDGKQRTAWPAHPITWYTYMYFSVASISFLFNFAILIAYWRGVKKANSVASAASCWSHLVLVGHVVIWVVSTALYKLSSLPIAGEFRGLWGW